MWSDLPQGLNFVFVGDFDSALEASWEIESMNKICCACLNRVWKSFQKHSVILLAAVTSTHHGASVTRKAPGYRCCEVTAHTAAREYCGFSENGGKVFERPFVDVPTLSQKNNTTNMWQYLLVFIWSGFQGGQKLLRKNLSTSLDGVNLVASFHLSSVFNIK